jgi:DNA primase
VTGPKEGRVDHSALIEKLLANYSVWQCKPNQWRSACPYHQGVNHTAFSIFRDGRFRCFRCDAHGDIYNLVSKITGLNFPQAKEFVGTGNGPAFFRGLDVLPSLPPWGERKRLAEPIPLRESVLGAYRANCPTCLLTRGYSPSVLRRFEIGYDTQNRKVILPVRDHKGRLMGLVYRIDYDAPSSTPKYWNDNFNKANFLYGLHLYARRKISQLYITEGQLDCVRLFQLGCPAVALMGCRISDLQIETLQAHAQADQIVLALDNDEAGKEGTRFAIKQLIKTRFGPGLGVLQYDGKDPGELTATSRREIVPYYKWDPLPERLTRKPATVRPAYPIGMH